MRGCSRMRGCDGCACCRIAGASLRGADRAAGAEWEGPALPPGPSRSRPCATAIDAAPISAAETIAPVTAYLMTRKPFLPGIGIGAPRPSPQRLAGETLLNHICSVRSPMPGSVARTDSGGTSDPRGELRRTTRPQPRHARSSAAAAPHLGTHLVLCDGRALLGRQCTRAACGLCSAFITADSGSVISKVYFPGSAEMRGTPPRPVAIS